MLLLLVSPLLCLTEKILLVVCTLLNIQSAEKYNIFLPKNLIVLVLKCPYARCFVWFYVVILISYHFPIK